MTRSMSAASKPRRNHNPPPPDFMSTTLQEVPASTNFAKLKANRQEQRQAVAVARPALNRLVLVCRHQTGQGYKLRALLYSLWNGKRVNFSDLLSLDWDLRKDFLAVAAAFGFESLGESFFYKDIEAAFKDAGLFDWFIEEGDAK